MSIKKMNGSPTFQQKNNLRRRKLGAILFSDPSIEDNYFNNCNYIHNYYNDRSRRNSTDNYASSLSPSYITSLNNNMTTSSNPSSVGSSPFTMSPWSEPSPYTKSPWTQHQPDSSSADDEYDVGSDGMKNHFTKHGLIGSLFREEGHIYSLAASGDLLYTGSDSKNIRVWKDLEDYSGFKSSSGLVKAIVVFGDRIFTGHQDGKIRVWSCKKNDDKYKRVGNLPMTRDLLMKSLNPRNYIQVRRKSNVPWIKHYDAVSCMHVDVEKGLLYSGSWDKTLKVWRISDYKCLESVHAHDDAVNSVVIAFDGLVFTGSADGTVKAWRREMVENYTKHVLVETLLKQDHSLTSLAVNRTAGAVYAGSSDGLVSFWEREKNFMSYGGVLRGHKLAVLCLAAAGNLIISGSADKSICVWRRDVGGVHACVAVLTGHSGPVKCLTVEKDAVAEEEKEVGDERWIVYSGSLDKSVKVWRVSQHAPSLKELKEK